MKTLSLAEPQSTQRNTRSTVGRNKRDHNSADTLSTWRCRSKYYPKGYAGLPVWIFLPYRQKKNSFSATSASRTTAGSGREKKAFKALSHARYARARREVFFFFPGGKRFLLYCHREELHSLPSSRGAKRRGDL